MTLSKRSKTLLKIITLAALFTGICGGGWGAYYYLTYYQPNIQTHAKNHAYVFIPSGGNFSGLLDSLNAQNLLKNPKRFLRAAQKEQLAQRIKAGRYRLENNLGNKAAVRIFTLGLQSPVKLTISGSIRSKERLAGILSRPIEADSAQCYQVLNDEALLQSLGMDSTSLFAFILPNTYEVYWNTPPKKILERLLAEYQNFWNPERTRTAETIGMKPLEVSILASILCEETRYEPEMPVMAGVYINRLRLKMPLQADPTVKFALRDPSIQRVLYKHLEVDSPYNTYKHTGLPPGPICVPSIASIEAVLHYQTHNYLYFCASPDFNGSHLFASSLKEHSRNARAFHKALNERNIK
jgi:conserved hypothetical protein, YceG family